MYVGKSLLLPMFSCKGEKREIITAVLTLNGYIQDLTPEEFLPKYIFSKGEGLVKTQKIYFGYGVVLTQV